jgi:ABC-2 type transport system ATP-binding protein
MMICRPYTGILYLDRRARRNPVSIIEVESLQKRYGDTIAVKDVSLSVEEGEIFGIIGPNGAGKTTTVECIAGMREPDGGSITVAGLNPPRDRDRLRQILGMQLQESALPEKLKVGEAIDLYASFYEHPADMTQLLHSLGLEDKLGTRYGKLSGGQKQRLSIALALIGRPRIAILDELTTGLDPQARRDTWSLIEAVRDQGVTVVLVTHFMEEAERLCDRVAMIDAGRVVAIGSPASLAESAGGLQALRFTPSRHFNDALLDALTEVDNITWHGESVEVTGTGDLLGAVVAVLSREGVVATQLRFEQRSLEDAFVSLIGDAHHE